MDRWSNIYVAGHTVLAMSAIALKLKQAEYRNVMRTHREMDLTNQAAANELFEAQRPEHVFPAAVRVGGIPAGNTFPARFIHDNLLFISDFNVSVSHDQP